jgi:hypothetical protein
LRVAYGQWLSDSAQIEKNEAENLAASHLDTSLYQEVV